METPGGVMVGVNTLLPNRLMHQALLQGAVPELAGYGAVRREGVVGYSRLDLMLGRSPPLCYIEIKNVTLVLDGAAAGSVERGGAAGVPGRGEPCGHRAVAPAPGGVVRWSGEVEW